MFSSCLAKNELVAIINSSNFKNLFLDKNITNVIIFGSFTGNEFTDESDIDIAIISYKKLSFSDELELTQALETLLERDIDLIDINDENVNTMVKISALNSKFVVLKDDLLEETFNFYDNLYKENEEFWFCLDRQVLNYE